MTIAILGGGQLARMLVLAGTPLGLRFRCLDPAPDAVAGHVCEHLCAPFDDPDALAKLARGAEVVTFEFENVPAATTERLLQHGPVRPHPRALATGQDRLFEKQLFQRLGMGVPEYRTAHTLAELQAAVAAVGAPCIVKTRRLGYDGRGQARLKPGPELAAAIAAAHRELTRGNDGGLIVERFVPFQRELSVLAVRSLRGEIAVYPLVENVHEGGILRRSRAPAPDVSTATSKQAHDFVAAVLQDLDYVGVLAIELFDLGGTLLANEMAPRVHNSGHWTIEGSVCSQFENHVRAVAGLPLGSTAMAHGQATMVNCISTLPARDAALALPGVHVHAYGKQPRENRKVGHATVVGADRAAVDALAAKVSALPPARGEW
ncbi:MAG: 5-(carboxyamino)imidazole ribonucleotide synthase [Planctomycetota bacterium]|jgi:5-(carboxyamino)imidazole ribonucleotide synthase